MQFYKKIQTELNIQPSIFFLITSHHPPCQLNRTWKLTLFGHKIFICTRCFGQYAGTILGVLSIILFSPTFSVIEALFLFGLLPFPATLDWLTQTIMPRESINPIRALTGFLFGLSVGVCLGCILSLNLGCLLIAIPIYSLYMIIGFGLLQRSNIIQDYLTPYEDFLSESQ